MSGHVDIFLFLFPFSSSSFYSGHDQTTINSALPSTQPRHSPCTTTSLPSQPSIHHHLSAFHHHPSSESPLLSSDLRGAASNPRPSHSGLWSQQPQPRIYRPSNRHGMRTGSSRGGAIVERSGKLSNVEYDAVVEGPLRGGIREFEKKRRRECKAQSSGRRERRRGW